MQAAPVLVYPQAYAVGAGGVVVSGAMSSEQVAAAVTAAQEQQRQLYLERRRVACVIAWITYGLGFIWLPLMWISNAYLCPFQKDPEVRCQRLTLAITSVVFTLLYVIGFISMIVGF